jgi:hypothetical protein
MGDPAMSAATPSRPSMTIPISNLSARVYGDAKADRDVGEICGIGEIGVTLSRPAHHRWPRCAHEKAAEVAI